MLVLSILIMSALAVAVASFFVAGGQWLLFVSAALVLTAFYLSRRTSRANAALDALADAARPPARAHLTVTLDDQIIESGRPGDAGPTANQVPSESGRAVAS
jgi:uncharacterized protein (DUF58 family)